MTAQIYYDNDADLSVLKNRFEEAGISMKYYTPEVHKAAFALPQFIKDLCV